MSQNESMPDYNNPQEYLDQIAAKKTSRFMFLDKKMLILAGAVILLIVFIIVWVSVSSTPKQSSESELLAVRLQNMNTLLDYDSSKISDSQKKKAIAETKVVFASQNYQLSQNIPLTISSEASKKESVSSTIEALDKSVISNSLSEEYTSALNAQLNSIIDLLTKIKATSDNTYTEQAILDLSELSNRLSVN